MGSENGNFDDLQYCRLSKRWVGGPKKSQKCYDVILKWSLTVQCNAMVRKQVN